MAVYSFKETKVYIKAFEMAMEIFELTKQFPSEEKYSLTDKSEDYQEVFAQTLLKHFEKNNIQPTSYPKFRCRYGKLRNIGFEFSFSCGYITKETLMNLTSKNSEIGKFLYHILKNPDKY